MGEIHEVMKLLRRVATPGFAIPPGATDDELDAFTARSGIELPRDLRTWLKMTNGPIVGPAIRLFGIGPGFDWDIASMSSLYEFRDRGWIPVTSDGCGNYYLIVPTRRRFPVVFVDTMQDPMTPTFVVASNVIRFLRFFFENYLEETEWPFDVGEMLQRDPELATFTEFRMPWES